MSQIVYSANLASTDFPFLSQFGGRTVIVGKNDQDFQYDASLNSGAAQQRLVKEKQIPQVFYCHNVIPTGQGYQSIGFTQKIPGLLGQNNFTRTYPMFDIAGNKFLYNPASGKNFVYDGDNGTWVSTSPIPGQETALVTLAYIDGHTYVFYEGIGCFEYDTITKTFVSVTLIGLIAANIKGICSSFGYLLAFDDFFVYRGQAVNILDFTPNPTLGSGASIPEDIKTKILTVLPINGGYIIYTGKNAIGASFTNNIQYPFTYKEVEGSTGVMSPDHISWQDSLSEHYCWTLNGLQKVGRARSVPIFAEATDFLVAKIMEDFDPVTWTFTVNKLTSQLQVMVNVVANRWLTISYGVTLFTHCLIFDLALRRWGKIKLTHTSTFDFQIPNIYGDVTWEMFRELAWQDLGDTTWADLRTQVRTVEEQKAILGFTQLDGTCYIVNFGQEHSGDSGVILLGKYQYVRERLLCIDEIDLENADSSNNFELRLLTSYDGKNFDAITTPYLDLSKGQYRRYLCGNSPAGINHTVAGYGTFHLLSEELTMHIDGHM